jgi:hypothetical protein
MISGRKGRFAAFVQFAGFGLQHLFRTCRRRCQTSGPAWLVERENFAHDVFELVGRERRSRQHGAFIFDQNLDALADVGGCRISRRMA